MSNKYPFYRVYSENSIAVVFGDEISPEINEKVILLERTFEREHINGIIEVVPTYTTLLVYYDLLVFSYEDMISLLDKLLNISDGDSVFKRRTIKIPVLYGDTEDIDFVLKHTKLNLESLIEIHTKNKYLVYMLGFTPGFAYLGGMDERLFTPRLESPRLKIPAGSVAIAAYQTGVYSVDSPGGWRVIGRTPLEMYNPERKQPILLRAGDYVKFESIRKEEYERWYL
ncbi:MAG: allophanate hydrolase [Clostridiales bacterium]|nr:MAG: allophanate hydrolase [Clostridiales bacterium]